MTPPGRPHPAPVARMPIRGQDRNRPLLATPDPLARMRELYAVRDPLYREVADIVVDTGRQSVQNLAREVLGRLKETWKLSA